MLGWNYEIYVTRKIERKFLQTISRYLVRDDDEMMVDCEMGDHEMFEIISSLFSF